MVASRMTIFDYLGKWDTSYDRHMISKHVFKFLTMLKIAKIVYKMFTGSENTSLAPGEFFE